MKRFVLLADVFVAIFCLATALSLLVAVPARAELQASAPAPVLFDIGSFEVEGNTLLDPVKIQSPLAAFTGTQRNFGDVQKALEALQQAYFNAGFGAVQVRLPEQEMDQGVIRFIVVEGRIRRLSIEGNEHHDEANILNGIPSLREGESPSAARIESSLKLVNENPSKKAQVFLKTGLAEGEIEANVKVADEKPWKAGLTLDNTGSAQTGEARIGAFYQHSNLLSRDHVFTMQYTTSPGHFSDVSIIGAGYHIPIYKWGDSVDVFAGYSDVNSGTVQGLFNVSGSGNIYGARYNHNFARRDTYDHKLIFGLDYRAYKNDVQQIGGSTSLVPDVTVRPVSLTYAGQWQWQTSQLAFNLAGVHNISGGGQGSKADFGASRTGADANYTLFRYGVNYIKQFPNDWQVHLVLNGQKTNDALVAGEQFGIAGMEAVRGFFEREVANDEGHHASAELYTPDWGAKVGPDSVSRALLFYDAGQVSRNHSQPREMRASSIGSIGAGLRMTLSKQFNVRADLARVLDEGGTRKSGDTRLHISLGLVF